MREYQARFCEKLGVKFPWFTRSVPHNKTQFCPRFNLGLIDFQDRANLDRTRLHLGEDLGKHLEDIRKGRHAALLVFRLSI